MSTARRLLRTDLRDFTGYRSARSDTATGAVWLNANESAWPSAVDDDDQLRRYPQPQPEALRNALCALYGVSPAQLLIGRGSDEGIDLLLRAMCAPGQGSVVIAPPVFGMYAVCARLQGVRIIEAPLVDGDAGLAIDLDAVGDAVLASGASIVFLCSPGNPSGEALPPRSIGVFARRLEGRAIVVVDEAYAEYSDQASSIGLLPTHDNLAILRTLSKAHALAAARIGCVIAAPELIAALRRCQPPYPVPQPCTELALAALQPPALAQMRSRVAEVKAERTRLLEELRAVPGVRRVYPSQGNFLLLRLDDVDAAMARLLADGVVVRDMRALPQLGDALRISIGRPDQNDRVLAALGADAGIAA